MREDSTTSSFLLCQGEMLPADAAVLPVNDRAVAFGAGLFETMAAYGGRPFAFEKHIARLREGMKYFGISLALPADLESQAQMLLEKNGLAEEMPARLRLTVTAGAATGSPCWILEATPAPPHSAEATLLTGAFVRNEQSPISQFKTINYGDNHIAMQRARAAEMTEVLFSNTRGNICEGTWSNFFFYHDECWKTPPVTSGCLPGITRATVLELAKKIGLAIEEADLPLSRIGEIESAFLTSTMRGIQPVVAINEQRLPVSCDETRTLTKTYHELVTPCPST